MRNKILFFACFLFPLHSSALFLFFLFYASFKDKLCHLYRWMSNCVLFYNVLHVHVDIELHFVFYLFDSSKIVIGLWQVFLEMFDLRLSTTMWWHFKLKWNLSSSDFIKVINFPKNFNGFSLLLKMQRFDNIEQPIAGIVKLD